jgi:hypothetical protein
MDPRKLQGLPNPPGVIEQPPVESGYVSTARAAPTSFEDPIYVILPEHSTDRPIGPLVWPAIHGSALPQQGAPVTVVFDGEDVPHVVWWEGTTTNLEDTGWLPATLENGWANKGGSYALAAYRRFVSKVTVSAVFSPIGNSGSRALILPAGFRPRSDVILPAVCSSTNLGYAEIRTGGEVVIYYVGEPIWVSITEVQFSTN